MSRRSLAAFSLAAALLAVLSAPVARGDDKPAGPSSDPKADPKAPAKPEDPVVALLGRLKDDQGVEVRSAALKEAKSIDDPRLVPALAKLLKAPEKTIRLDAIEDLGARASVETKKKAATALAERLKALDLVLAKDPGPKDEAVAVANALHDLAMASTIDALLDGIDLDEDLEVLEARAMAVGNIPDAKAIESLIDLMGRGRRGGGGHGSICTKALRYATGASLNRDVDAWRAWWHTAKPHFDFDAAAKRREGERAQDEAKQGRKAGKKAGSGKDDRKPGDGKPQEGGGEKPGDGMGDGATPSGK